MSIKEKVAKLRNEIPGTITLVAATKKRTSEEIQEALAAGITHVGENYVQEAEEKKPTLKEATWHLIGHLQTNKVKTAVKLFDIIETVDSEKLAKEISKQAKEINKTMTILIEINSGKEESKNGILPEQALELIKAISELKNIKIEGLMTMAPLKEDPELARPFFKATKQLFEEIKALSIENIEMKTLSMGMSHSYKIAIEEGATEVRLGTILFGER
tara:strand:+ start:203 stop:853 length:651 start_codon:yes stop_codon:yes gene_type:complete